MQAEQQHQEESEPEPEGLRLYLPPQYRLLAPVASVAATAAPVTTAALAPVAGSNLEPEGSLPFLSPQYRLLAREVIQAEAQLRQQQSWDVAVVVAATAATKPQGMNKHVSRLMGADGPLEHVHAATASSAQGMSEAEVRAAAEAEGLTLVQCTDHQSGFRGVTTNRTRFQANFRLEGGKVHYLGLHATALEAALQIARFLGGEGSAVAAAEAEAVTTARATSKAMSDAEVHAAAEAEELTLVPSENTSGFKGVTSSAGGSSRSQAKYTLKGRLHNFGHFETPLQAALSIARFLGSDGSAAAAAAAAAAATAAAAPQGMSEGEVRTAAEAEGLTLVQSSDHQSGFKGVSTYPGGRFQAGLRIKGKRHNFGTFLTPLEAVIHLPSSLRILLLTLTLILIANPNPSSNQALCVARFLGPHGSSAAAAVAAAVPSPLQKGLNEAEIHESVEAEGLTLVPAFRPGSFTGFRGVTVRGNSFQASSPEATHEYIGTFPSALEAALHVARHLGRDASAAAFRASQAATSQGMSDAEVWVAAEAEGLTLVQSSDHKSGFKGVSAHGSRYQAISSEDRTQYLGRFDSALEAALHVARSTKAAASASVAAAPSRKRSLAQGSNDGLSAAAAVGAAAVRRRLAIMGARPGASASGATLASAPRHGMVRKKRRVALVDQAGTANCPDSAQACWLSAARKEQRLGDYYQARLPVCNALPVGDDSTADAAARVCRKALEQDAARDSAALLTAAAFGLDAFSFVAPCDCGLGLFARVPLRAGQFISEYSGPRLPQRLHVRGRYVLQVPGTPTVIDGASENSPFECERSPAVYTNHSSQPNARLQCMPALPQQGIRRMLIMALEPIEVGQEVRIDYEDGKARETAYWGGQLPIETAWRCVRVHPPPPTLEEPSYGRLGDWKEESSPTVLPAVLPWEGTTGGDARLQALVSLFSISNRHANESAWPLVSTHLPGRSWRECRERWVLLECVDAHTAWLTCPASASISHTEAAATMAETHRAVAAKAATEAGEEGEVVRCCILGCTKQLLQCNGQKHAGLAVGCAESWHVLCAPCLGRWYTSQAALRDEFGLPKQTRRSCPVCQTELRAAGSEIRGVADHYAMGLQKVAGTWNVRE